MTIFMKWKSVLRRGWEGSEVFEGVFEATWFQSISVIFVIVNTTEQPTGVSGMELIQYEHVLQVPHQRFLKPRTSNQ